MRPLVAALFACGAPDADEDGWPSSVDCDDADGAVHPAAAEVCNGTDDDCDGTVDAGAVDATAWFTDADGDGEGDARTLVLACDAPTDAVASGLDCDDADPEARPGAAERCNGLDDDCDRQVDEDVDGEVPHYADADGDGHGDPATADLACAPPPGAVSLPDDCDDGDAAVHPGAAETCDGRDEDCDTAVDEDALDAATWHPDVDGDTFGAAGVSVVACEAPAGHLADGTDCDDGAPDTFPGASETCDGDDNDCDGQVDLPDPVGTLTWYTDGDGDGFGADATAVEACAPPAGAVSFPWDCDDGDPARHPLVAEVCDDGVDNDCDGVVDGCGAEPPVTDLPASAADADVFLDGPSSSDSGEALALADLDGDGRADLLVGGPEADLATGRVWLLYGAPASGALDGVADATFDGLDGGGQAGTGVGALGDLDGDGYDDAGVAAPQHDGNGAVWLLYGGPTRASGALDFSTWDAEVVGNSADEYLGLGAPTGLGDLDDDGYNDMAFAAYSRDVPSASGGSVFFVYGGPTRLSGPLDETTLPTLGGQANDLLCAGRCLAAGDLDGDGVADLATGNAGNTSEGHVYVRYGDGGRVGAAETTAGLPYLDADQPGAYYARALTVPGDVDGDGYDDLAIGDSTSDVLTTNGGLVWIVGGGATRLAAGADLDTTAWARFVGLQAGGELGASLAGVGDMDGDGTDDLAVGAPYTDGDQPSSGVVALFAAIPAGQVRLGDATHVIAGAIGGGGFGRSMAVGDVDGDGVDDLAVAADAIGYEAGQTVVFLDTF